MTGMTTVGIDNGLIILYMVRARRLDELAGDIAIMTAITESNIYNLANPSVPESLTYPHDGTGTDHDSLGVFQQRASWGSVADRMTVDIATGLFLDRFPAGWETMLPWQVAQSIQVSADSTGSNYQQHYTQAQQFVSQYWSQAVLTDNDVNRIANAVFSKIITNPKYGLNASYSDIVGDIFQHARTAAANTTPKGQ